MTYRPIIDTMIRLAETRAVFSLEKMSRENELSKLLAVSPKVVGSKQVSRGLSEGTIRCVIVAEDAECALKSKLVASAENAGVPVLFAPDMAWLGRESGIEVGASAVGIVAQED